MNHTMRFAAAAAFCALLLTGCGAKAPASSAAPTASSAAASSAPASSAAPQAEFTFSPEEIRANNTLAALLERHSSFAATVDVLDGSGAALYHTKAYYTLSTDAGVKTTILTTDENGEPSIATAAYIAEGVPGAMYITGSGMDAMYIMPAATYETCYTDAWTPAPKTENDTEEVLDISDQDGAKIVRTKVTYTYDTESYAENMYYVDPANGDLLYLEVNSYSVGDPDTPQATIKTFPVYDEPYAPEGDPVTQFLGSDDPCDLTVVFVENGEAQNFKVTKGATVYVDAPGAYELFTDEACTQPTDSIDTTGESCTVYAKPMA